MRKITFSEATREAMAEEMEKYPEVFVMGEDLARQGGIFGQFKGLPDEFPGRVIDTPISETFIVGDMPFGSYQEGPQQAIRNACRMLAETNCDCIKLEGGGSVAPTIRALVDVGIPVCAHIGLTPQSATSVGGFKVQGGTPEGAKKLILDAKAVEAAGAFAMVLECVPSVVAQAVQAAISIPVLGIGAGPELPCQVLIFHDMMDMYGDFKPKFVKQFAHIRAEMVGALNAFHTETADGAFPTPEFSFNKQVEIPPLED